MITVMAVPTMGEPAGAVTVKPVITGLLDRGMDDPSQPWTTPPSAYLGTAVDGIAVNVAWSELEPAKNGPIQTHTRLSRALALVRSYNLGHPTAPLHIRLRVFAGNNSPAWAMNLDGSAMTLRCDTTPVPFKCFAPGPQTIQVPRFWGPKFTAAYDQLMTKLSAMYDSAPEISEIVTSQCTTSYPEPFLRQFYEPGNPTAYVNAGWTEAADQGCLKSELNIFDKTWPTTNVGMALNPWDTLNSTTLKWSHDEGTTVAMMAYCRRSLGTRCVLENYSTRSTNTLSPTYAQMYNSMVAEGDPLAYQTAIDSRVGSLDATLCDDLSTRLALDIELPRGYNDPSDRYGVYRTPAQLEPYNQALVSGAHACP
jgi:hypothetical protein